MSRRVSCGFAAAVLLAATMGLQSPYGSAEPTSGAGYSPGPMLKFVEYAVHTRPSWLTTGSDGRLWFARDRGGLGRFNPTTHAVTLFAEAPGCGRLGGITKPAAAADGGVWYDCGFEKPEVVRVTATGKVAKEQPLPTTFPGFGRGPGALIETSNGSVVVTVNGDEQHVGRLTADGGFAPYRIAGLRGVAGFAPAADGAVWVIGVHNAFVRVDAAGTVKKFPIPGGGSNGGSIASDRAGGAWTIVSESSGQAKGLLTAAHVDAAGKVATFPLADNVAFFALAVDLDGDLLSFGGTQIDPTATVKPALLRVTPSGKAMLYELPPDLFIADLAVTKDGTIWFTNSQKNRIGRFARF